MRRIVVMLTVMAVSALVTHLAHAQTAHAQTAHAQTNVNVTPDGVAIGGYDTVTYFTEGEAVMGDPVFSHEWNGAVWQFVNAENKTLFAHDPEAYAPQFGGWCAYALSVGEYAAEVDPAKAWTVDDGKLYLNWDEQVRSQWTSDMDSRIDRGVQNWQTVAGQVIDGSAAFSRKPNSLWRDN